MKKQLLAAGIISTIGLTGAIGAASVSAMSGDGENSRDGMISSLVEKFDLNKTEVESFFNDQQEARQAEQETQQTERLAAAVEDGTLTQAQSDLIKEKSAELKADREAGKDSDQTREERKTERDAKHTELQAWIEENDIPEGFLDGGPGNGQGGPGRGMANK